MRTFMQPSIESLDRKSGIARASHRLERVGLPRIVIRADAGETEWLTRSAQKLSREMWATTGQWKLEE